MKIALDAMGGDFAPSVNVQGAISACAEMSDLEVVLVGDEARLFEEMKGFSADERRRVHLHHAPEVVGMHESPVEACRSKPDSSIVVASKLLADSKVDAMVSAGNSGATMTASLFSLGRLEGISRPAIATILPTLDGHCVMLDMGANMDCKPKHLLQFAVMGAVYFEAMFHKKNPTVGLLSIGEEEGKGNELTTETHLLLKNSGLNYVGNVEGRDIPFGKADVVVCDGFVGNVVLKFGEGLASAMLKLIKNEVKAHPISIVGGLLLRRAFRRIKTKVDPHEYGGAPLLGLRGISIVSHGSSNGRAIQNAIRVAHELVRDNINQHISDKLKNTSQHIVLA